MQSEPSPVVIEAAITPLLRGVPAQSVDDMVAEAVACVDAGAGIIHHHHDNRLDADGATVELIETGRRILDARPGTLVYTDYLPGRTASEENAHLRPMAEAGVLSMFAIDPGITSFASRDEAGLPTRTYTDGLRFDEAHAMVELSKEMQASISLGVFEPGALRWILAYERAAGFSPGTMVKLYFGGTHMVDQPGEPGVNFGLPPTPEALDVYLAMMAESILPWTVSLFGDPILDSPLARAALDRGGHLRVGVEDAAGASPLSNAEMVAQAVSIATDVGRPVARGQEALAVLVGSSGSPPASR